MSVILETGYLETPYLDDYPYLSGQIQDAINMQVEMKVNVDNNVKTQVEMLVFKDKIIRTQVDMRIDSVADDYSNYTQVDMKTVSDANINAQVDMKLLFPRKVFTQVDMKTPGSSTAHMQVWFSHLAHYICGGYLDELPYLSEPYLAPRFCASQFTQVEMKRYTDTPVNTQVEMKIVDTADDPHVNTQVEMRVFKNVPVHTQVDMQLFTDKHILTQVEMRIVDPTDDPHAKTQVEMRVFKDVNKHLQVNMLKAEKLFTQVTMVIYNITQMRFLCNFASRGTEALMGNNWVSVQPVSAGDFSPNNLNTDIVEQRTQTASVGLWQLRCNTGNPNTFVDTIGILNHNLTRAASVEVSGSDDALFSTIKFSYNMLVETENMYYIAPTLPNIPAQYYQFTIQDPGNAAGVLSIGTIVFGSASILTLKEQFLNPVRFGRRHFKDTLDTEGFTSVSNDRAMRKYLNLTFAQLIREGGNFRALSSYILDAKTDHKCLIIPRPTVPSALAVFAKMSQLPEEEHNAIDDNNWRIDMTFDWDESL